MKLSWTPTRILPLRGAFCAGLAAALALGACGDDDKSGPGQDVPLFDVPAVFPDVPVTPDTVLPDASTPDVATNDVLTPQDTAVPELVPDLEPPFVATSTPADGASSVALPLTITLNFNEPLLRQTVNGSGAQPTIKLFGFNNEEIPITATLEQNDSTVTLRPVSNNQQLVSPYRVRILGGNPAISDKAGNRIVNNIDIRFTTANYANLDVYQDIARRYAPTIYSAVANKELPQAQVPTKFDVDGDWNLANSRQWLRTQASSIIPAVYFTVAETYTHYFVTYQYFFPDVNHTTTARQHANGSSGVMITVEKAKGEVPERPIAAHVYTPSGLFEGADNEEQFAFITTESGVSNVRNLHVAVSEGNLFPNGRFESFIEAKTHIHCNRNHQFGSSGACSSNYKNYIGDYFVFKFDTGSPRPFQKQNTAWPSTMSEINGTPEALDYALIPIGSTVWPRRFQNGSDELFQSTAFTFAGRGADFGNGLRFYSKFIESVDTDATAIGKPVWGWRWKPSSTPISGSWGVGGFMLETGAIGLDPAHYFFQRHNTENQATNPLKPWDATAKTGFATNYCFNMFLNIDRRAVDPDCLAPTAQ